MTTTATFTRLRGDHPLVVYVDLKSPYAYLAVEPTRDMARAAGVPVHWRPFTLDIASYLGSARLDREGRVAASQRTAQQWSGVKYAYMDARRYANLTGRTVRGTIKIWDSSLAGIALAWASRHAAADAWLDAAYPAFWRRELDIEDPSVVRAVLDRAGVPTEGFADYALGPGRAEHDRTNREAFDAGIFGVPTYLVADEMWFGREHLPRVAWLLAGAVGAGPDVANRCFADAEFAGAGGPAAPAPGDAAADPGASRVLVFLDIAQPACALALEPTLALADEAGARLDLLPTEVPALREPGPQPADDDRGARHRCYRAQALEREYRIYGTARGLDLGRPWPAVDRRALYDGWLWLRESAPERLPDFLRRAFGAWWSREPDLDDAGVIAGLLTAVGADPQAGGFRSWRRTRASQVREALGPETRERGAPSYVVGDEYFIGRQHLAMIRWLLADRPGRGPI